MSSKKATEPFVMLPRSLLSSTAWQSLNINARRFIDFLMLEHMRHGGQENGHLLAPRRQLYAFGIGAHYVSNAIDEADRLGLVDCKRGVGRRPSHYALTWLPVKGADAPTHRWRSNRSVVNADEHPLRMDAEQHSQECKRAFTRPLADAEQHSRGPKSRGAKQHSPSRRSYQAGEADSEPSAETRGAGGHR